MKYAALRHGWLIGVALLVLVFTADMRADLPRNTITVAAPVEGGTEKCVRAVAPAANCAAVSDAGSVLVIGTAPPEDGSLLVFTLDGAGAIAQAEPTRLAMTKPASLAAFRVVPTAIYAHPRLPLVYVWQDVMPATGTTVAPPADAVHRDFDHLLIYKIAGGTPELVKATARGPWFSFGIGVASLNSDATAAAAPDDRLYLPNIQRPEPVNPPTYTPMFTYVTLDEAGMPAETDPGAPGLALHALVDQTSYAHVERPMGVVPFSKKRVFYGTYMAVASLEYEGTGQVVSMPCYGTHYDRATGHPTLPRIYAAGLNSANIYNFDHADGLFTMLPQFATVSGLYIQSPPVLDVKSNRLMVGGQAGVHLIVLDDQGLIAGTQQFLNVGHAVRAVAYSPRFDRIYVPVEKLE